jgi:uncharacterized membrane protein YfcA
MEYLIGFIIAVFIALTGVGAGTITTPLLILFLGVPTPVAVATGLMFSAAVKLALVLGYMLLGGLPGVLLGSLVLSHLVSTGAKHGVNAALGCVLVLTALYQIVYSFRKVSPEHAGVNKVRWLPWLMLPVGAEVGFSSAGAGALGTAALLSLTTLAPPQVVGTDILFGFTLSLIGSGAHLAGGSHIHSSLLLHLVIGGLIGVIFGSSIAKYVPKRPLRFALWVWLFLIGTEFIYRNA